MSDRDPTQSPLWIGVLVAAAIPFIIALAALTLPGRDALPLAGLGWLANQAIGFGFLGYPLDAMTLAWGIALGLSALAAVGGALFGSRQLAGADPITRPVAR